MKKTIKLTESELINLVKRIINEVDETQVNIDGITAYEITPGSGGFDSPNLSVKGKLFCTSCQDPTTKQINPEKVKQAIGDNCTISVYCIVDEKFKEVFNYKVVNNGSLIFQFEFPKQNIPNLTSNMKAMIVPKKDGAFVKGPDGKNIMAVTQTTMI